MFYEKHHLCCAAYMSNSLKQHIRGPPFATEMCILLDPRPAEGISAQPWVNFTATARVMNTEGMKFVVLLLYQTSWCVGGSM